MSCFRASILLLLAFISAVLSGCSSARTVRTSAVIVPTASETADEVRNLYSRAEIPVPETNTSPKTIEPAQFASAGFRIVDSSCTKYFDALTRANQHVKMSKADWTAIGTAAAVVATLASSPPKEIGIIAAGFGLGASIFENYEQYAFATPYPLQTRTLVFKALKAYRESSPPASAASLDDAADRIAGYARLCTYSGIASLSEEAIAKATPVDTAKSTQLVTPEQRTAYLNGVDRVLGVASGATLPNTDYLALAVIADKTVSNPAHLQKLKSMLSPAVDASKVLDASNAKVAATVDAIGVFLSLLVSSNSSFAAQVEHTKKLVTADGTGAATETAPATIQVLQAPPVISIL